VRIQVKLPNSGRDAWPVNDVVVTDSKGKPLPVLRSGIQWENLLLTLPPQRKTYVITTVEPKVEPPPVFAERDRSASEPKSGLSVRICRFHGDKRAALSIRFDDSHPTHLSKAIPILNEYGFKGTFMVNPGGHPPNSRRRSAFEDHRAEWEAVARRGRHEFANHSLNHVGAGNHEAMDHEIGETARIIWRLFPQKSKVLALNLGGGTRWITSRPLRHYLDRYHHFDASSGSTGMDDVYGNRVATFKRLLKRHVERGLWYRVHYHYIGEGLSSSEENFRATLDVAKQHADSLWVAGMADIHRYQTERRAAKLRLAVDEKGRFRLNLTCATDPTLYDQPLTIAVDLPAAWKAEQIAVRDMTSGSSKIYSSSSRKNSLLFDVAPRNSEFLIERN